MNITVIFKSILHNIGVIVVGFLFSGIGFGLDRVFHINRFSSLIVIVFGVLLILMGFLLRVWATYYFYLHEMRVIVLEPQKHFITSGPYKFSRNPLYLGGNVFIFLGASLVLGTPMGILHTFLHLPLMDFMVRREERQLEERFGAEWLEYKTKVRRWI